MTTPTTFTNPILADLILKNAELEEKLKISNEKVAIVNALREAPGTQCFRLTAKLFRVSERVFSKFLVDKGYMYRRAGRLTPTKDQIAEGNFVANGEFKSRGVVTVGMHLQAWRASNNA